VENQTAVFHLHRELVSSYEPELAHEAGGEGDLVLAADGRLWHLGCL
jgi:hypothetical protein